jgi:two-component system cell cycle sensor histidine kinase PleC
MSHELRTPLNAILGFSEMISNEVYGPLGDERYKGYATDILESGRHLLEMINDVLDMAKIEAGKMQIAPRLIDATDAVDSAVRLIRRRASDKGVSLAFDHDDDLPDINGDHRAIKQMTLNLIANAIKFTPAGGRIAVLVRREASWLVISVADTGVGIHAADLPRIGQPFEQARSQDGQSHGGGTGLGLAITKSFAEMHGGRLQIESEVGAGTTVSIFLPLSEPNTHGVRNAAE